MILQAVPLYGIQRRINLLTYQDPEWLRVTPLERYTDYASTQFEAGSSFMVKNPGCSRQYNHRLNDLAHDLNCPVPIRIDDGYYTLFKC